jgi:pantetheine-phosphate adenylyltransferase
MIRAVFPGSFDPPTNGHLNVIERAAGFFDELLVVISVNLQKRTFFSPEERLGLMKSLLVDYKNVSVHLCDTLVVDFAKRHEAKLLLRGVRSVSDFSYEFELSIMNKGLDNGIETLFMPTDPRFFVLRSSAIKELLQFNGNISAMVPPIVEEALKKKYHKQEE